MRACHARVVNIGLHRSNAKRYLANSARVASEGEVSVVGELVLDDFGRVLSCNNFAANLFGTSPSTLVGMQIASLIEGFSLGNSMPADNNGLSQSRKAAVYWQLFRGICLDGSSFPLELRIKKPGMGKVDSLLLRNPCLQRQRRHLDPMVRLQQLAESSDHAVMIATVKAKITYVNPAFEALTGFRCQELLGQNASIFNAGAYDQRLFDYDCLWSALREGKEDKDEKEFPFCFVNRRKSGEFFFMEQIIRPFVTADGTVTHYVFTGRDISDRVESIRQLTQQASHDDLTGLSNRGLFLDRLRHAFSQAARRKDHFALLYVDLDGLKGVNDTYGHAAGDALLRTAALLLRQSVREGDTVARLGGDEFALILADAKKRDDVQKIVEKIFEVFQHGFVFENRRIIIRASIGACIYPENGDNCDQLIQRADKAMYKQKVAGGNGVCFFGT